MSTRKVKKAVQLKKSTKNKIKKNWMANLKLFKRMMRVKNKALLIIVCQEAQICNI